MRPPQKPINVNVNVMARKVDVDNRIPLRNYYRIADNLLKQASIYRGEKNIVDLYIILLRYSSLVSETIPFHRDYQVTYPKERSYYRKKLLVVIDELESLKPEFQHQVDKRNMLHAGNQQYQLDGHNRTSYGSELSYLEWPLVNNRASLSFENKQSSSTAPLSSWKQNNDNSQVLPSNSMDMQFQKLSVSLPLPKKETLSRHSFLGPTGLRGQWLGPTAEIKVHYPTYTDLTSNANSSPNQTGLYDIVAVKDGGSTANGSTAIDSVLSLDDGRWLSPAEDVFPPSRNEAMNDHFPLDPRPGPVKPFQDGTSSSNSYQHLHIPIKMMEDFLRLAQENTARNLETCGVLAGSLKNRVFHITTLVIPKQESTSDSCQTLNEEEIFEVQDKYSLFQLGWIHTHPSQTCFMSSVDLHTHYSYQIMLPEAIAIVMAPKDESRK